MTPELYRRAQELFLSAIEMDPFKREAWIDEQIGGDDELKKHVQSLLAHDNTQTLLAPRTIARNPSGRSRRNSGSTRPARWTQSQVILHKMPPRGLMAIGAIAVLLPVLLSGWFVNRTLDGFRNRLRATSLVDLVDSKSAAIHFWLAREKAIVQSWADSTKVRQLINELATIAKTTEPEELGDTLRFSPQQEQLNREMETLAGRAVRYAVWDKSLLTIADWSPSRSGLGTGVTPKGAERLTAVMESGATAMVIGPEDAITREYSEMPSEPIVAILVPVTDDNKNVIAVLMVGESGGTEDLGKFLGLSMFAGSDHPDGGIFIFDRSGMLLYNSPYDSQLRALGLIPAHDDSFSAKYLELRDPGVNLTRGEVPQESFAARPLTKMVRMAVSDGMNVDVDGYRDVRGVTVAGAWRWIEDYQFGVGIEVDKHALEPVFWLAQLQSWAMLGLIGTSLSVAAYSMFTIRNLRNNLASHPRLGPYVLEKLIGEGGMGRVFKARHDLLKRPTAIKLLRPEFTSDTSIARFQREAQLAARLEHPNTVSVFDFGLSEDNQFYLVMEWIDGVTLDRLVHQQGLIEIDRTISILRQIALSLREAHVLGLIHRDLKPSNIMLTQRASESDVVKVLDFGLARDLRAQVAGPDAVENFTELGFLAGTPRYMAPERWNATIPISPAIDVFAFGCIAYFVLTGRELLQGFSIEQICMSSNRDLPGRPSTIVGEKVPRWLDDLTARCTEREPAMRPSSFDAVLEIIDRNG